ncbi:hypothetical protein M434DRAFT_398160 [Hypoxylon sp. CO27-5]|nr:hypothetical protein M434DRAFT_398160 [Hypoxylon sp. CO27-5]
MKLPNRYSRARASQVIATVLVAITMSLISFHIINSTRPKTSYQRSNGAIDELTWANLVEFSIKTETSTSSSCPCKNRHRAQRKRAK